MPCTIQFRFPFVFLWFHSNWETCHLYQRATSECDSVLDRNSYCAGCQFPCRLADTREYDRIRSKTVLIIKVCIFLTAFSQSSLTCRTRLSKLFTNLSFSRRKRRITLLKNWWRTFLLRAVYVQLPKPIQGTVGRLLSLLRARPTKDTTPRLIPEVITQASGYSKWTKKLSIKHFPLFLQSTRTSLLHNRFFVCSTRLLHVSLTDLSSVFVSSSDFLASEKKRWETERTTILFVYLFFCSPCVTSERRVVATVAANPLWKLLWVSSGMLEPAWE